MFNKTTKIFALSGIFKYVQVLLQSDRQIDNDPMVKNGKKKGKYFTWLN